MLCDAGYKPVIFAEIRLPKPEKNKIQFVHVFSLAFGFGVYLKTLIGFKAFYFFSSVSVEPHQRHCVVVLEQDTFILA